METLKFTCLLCLAVLSAITLYVKVFSFQKNFVNNIEFNGSREEADSKNDGLSQNLADDLNDDRSFVHNNMSEDDENKPLYETRAKIDETQTGDT